MRAIVTTVEKAHQSGGDMSDVELARAAAGEDRIFKRRLVHRVLPRVQKTVRFLARGESDAEDLTQLSLLEIVRSIGSFRGDCELDYWTDRVVLQTLAKQFQRRRRRQQIRERYWIEPPAFPAVDDQAAVLEVRARLHALFGRLKERLRYPVVLRYVHGYDPKEIGALLDLKVNTVRGRLRAGVSKLRKLVLSDPALREWIEQGKR
jgi:RNA polymerase sigma-70 factor (ECF subfamily)